MARVGVLALQGAFDLHRSALVRAGHEAVLVRAAGDLSRLEGLVLPGGESTVQLDLARRLGLEAALAAALAELPVLATCAGLVLLAAEVRSPAQRSYALVDVTVTRNAWGRQVESFACDSDRGRRLVFIRAPRIVRVGAGVEVLDTLDGEPVLVRSGRILAATFHPELTEALDLYQSAFGPPRALAS